MRQNSVKDKMQNEIEERRKIKAEEEQILKQ